MKKQIMLTGLAAAVLATTAHAAPGTPNISWMPATQDSGSDVSVTWNMWWGENGTSWELLDGSTAVCSETIAANGSNAQTGTCVGNYAAGSHDLTVQLCNASGCSTSGKVTINVINGGTVNEAPTASLTGPTATAYTEGDTVNLSADASDVDGTVTSVEFFVDGVSVGSDSTAPFAVAYTAVAGASSITAVATDNLGKASAATAPIAITVAEIPNEAPVNVVASAPASSLEGDIELSATAADNDGTIASVEFFVDGASVGTDTAAPFAVTANVAAGDHSLTVVATDNDGASTSSAAVAFSAIVDTNVAPSVSVTAPANVVEKTSVTLAATAADSDGTVASVEFFIDGASVGTDTTSPYSVAYTAVQGTRSLTAVATDDKGASTTSVAASFVVADDGIIDNHADCRPEGLYQTPGVDVPYCSVYDTDGRELMNGKTRRVIGYYTNWRTGKNGQVSYLANDIPWDSLTHINYAFAHVNENNEVSVSAHVPGNSSTDMTWPEYPDLEMDNSLPYTGHFNILNTYKAKNPGVKTLVSIGGWAETGGYFGADGKLVTSGGFYTMTTNADGSTNYAGIEAFANSTVDFLRQYGFDGADIDYEYPTSMTDAGNPSDFVISNARRGSLNKTYNEMLRILREKLDIASAQDGKHYMLTIASPSSGYLLRGMEYFEGTKYLDYVNIMSYDLHGAWNEFVGPNAALFDNGKDSELLAGNAYGGKYEYNGYLNTDWAYHYFRGSMPAGRINIGVPYYTRGFQGVEGGTNGLWGTSKMPTQSECAVGTGTNSPCGYGAMGIDNLWHDKDTDGFEMGAGSNPMWHAMNLEQEIAGDYLPMYGFDGTEITGQYERHYDATMVTPWLWNETNKTFLSTEDAGSIEVKADYVIDQGIGGIMFWELAGDYDWNAAKGQYEIGSTMTDLIAAKFANAAPYGNTVSEIVLPTQAVDVDWTITGFKLGDQNYPINPDLNITNNTNITLPKGTLISFDYGTSAPANMTDQSGAKLTVVTDGTNAAGNNVGGLENNFHRVEFALAADLAIGESVKIVLNYYLPISTPSSWIVNVGGDEYVTAKEFGDAPIAVLEETGPGGVTVAECTAADLANSTVYPEFKNGNNAATNDLVQLGSTIYKAKWWTTGSPATDGAYEVYCNVK